MFCDRYDEFCSLLAEHGFQVHSARDGAAAKTIALDIIGKGSVGFGGSMTTAALGMYETLKAQGNAVYHHHHATPETMRETFLHAASADCYLCSSNAITGDGKLVNIDGRGNRVSAMFFGPAKVILIIGKNKYAPDMESAMKRIKAFACPQNARRLNMKTPCAAAGQCTDCQSPDRMCRVVTVIERPSMWTREFHLILADEALGY